MKQAARETRGRLKIFLGAAPGVGKAFEMLRAGAERLRAGSDVVIALVETGLAAEVTTQLVPTVAPYLYGIDVVVQAGAAPDAIEAVLLAEIQRMLDEPVTTAELAKAIKQTRAEFIYGAESVTDQAYWLGFAELVASQAWLDTYLEQVAAVTPGDIQRVARTYLGAGNRTVGTFVPTHEDEGDNLW